MLYDDNFFLTEGKETKKEEIGEKERGDWAEHAVKAVRSGATDFSYTMSGGSVVFACKQENEIHVFDAVIRHKKTVPVKEETVKKG